MGRCFVYVGNVGAVGNWIAEGVTEHGIAICEYNTQSGELKYIKNVFTELYISSMHLDRRRNILYAVDERVDYPGMRAGGGGRVVGFYADPLTGELALINCVPSYGANPVYCTTDLQSEFLLAVNHGSRATVTQTETMSDGVINIRTLHDESSLVLFPLGADGGIEPPCDLIRLVGEGPSEGFQLSAHAHCVVRSPSGEFYAVCDKGGDQIFMFRLDRSKHRLVLCPSSPYHCTPGSAPRYCVFHPTKPYIFVNKEHRAVVSSFRFSKNGCLTRVCTADSLPADSREPDGANQSGMCIDATGKYLYVLLRQTNTVAVFSVAQETGGLTKVQNFSCAAGAHGCAISPDGKFLVVAARLGKAAVSYPIKANGRLDAAVSSIAQPCPGSIVFYGK